MQNECGAVLESSTGDLLHYRELIRGPSAKLWETSCVNDFGRLAQGVGTRMPTGTNTIFFIPASKVPHDRKVSYINPVASIRPKKVEKHRVRLTAGGDRLDYPGITATDTVSLSTTEIHLNSVLSTPKAKYLTTDIKDFYYGTPLLTYEYLKTSIKSIPEEIVIQYDLKKLEKNGYVYMEIRKGIPGLKQAGKIANDRLKNHLAKFGYFPALRTPALWISKSNNISFTLCVDDFGIKYTDKKDAEHLLNALRQLYTISVDWSGTSYIGLTLNWDYNQRTLKISMPTYIPAALLRFQHQLPTRKQNSPHKWTPPIYGKKTQLVNDPLTSPTLSPAKKLFIQQVIGSLLYYALAVDCTLLVALGDLAASQANPTEDTLDKLVWLLNYVACNPDAEISYTASDMCLHVHSDASYLSAPKARSRAGAHFFLSTDPRKQESQDLQRINGPIHVLSKIIKLVMASAAEAEIGASFLAAQESIPLRTCLEELGHSQPPTPIQVDNTTAAAFANKTLKQKRSKAIDMRFYWLQDRCLQGQFNIFWAPGAVNLGDYHTKHHPPSHHKKMRPTIFNNI